MSKCLQWLLRTGFARFTLGAHLAAVALTVIGASAWHVCQPQVPPLGLAAGLLLAAFGLNAASRGLRRACLVQPERSEHPAHCAPPAHPVLPSRLALRRGLAWLASLLAMLGLVSGLVLGLASWRAQQRLADQLAPALEGRDVWVQGRISGLPQPSAQGLRFVLAVHNAVDAATGQPLRLPSQLWLNWPSAQAQGGAEPGGAAPPPFLQTGELWRLPLRLRRVHGASNPGGFDAEGWMFEQGLGGVGTVRAQALPAPQRLQAARAWHPGDALGSLRQRLRDAVLLQVADPLAAGVLAALAVGDQAAISPQAWAVLRDTGVSHLVSISGLHITLFAWLATGVLRRLWVWLPGAWQWALYRHGWPAPLAARWGGLLLALLYALLAGWGVPAQRTVWMLAASTVLLGTGRRWPGWLICLVAGAVVLLADPWAVLQAGFWLSFVAVGLLLLSDAPAPSLAQRLQTQAQAQAEELAQAVPPAPEENRRPAPCAWCEALRQGLKAQAVASVGLAPLTLLLFNQMSIVGIGVNLLAVPLVTFVITPLALGGMLWAPLWQLAGYLLPWLMRGLQAAAAQPWAVWSVPGLAWPLQALVLLGGAWLVLPLPWRVRCLALPLWWPLLWPPVVRPAPGQFELLAADVGQGSAVLIRTAQHSLLFDAGPAWADADAGTQVLLPLLRHLGERELHALVLSHADTDHIGGAPTLLARLPVRQLWASLAPQHPLWRAGVPARPCEAGQQWQWDGVRFAFLHPLPGGEPASLAPNLPGEAGSGRSASRSTSRSDTRPVDQPARKPAVKSPTNARSCVLKVTDAAGHAALLTGDIEAAQERALAAQNPSALRAELLLVPHHGSGGSSSAEFLAAVQPEWALVQVGYRSRFGHPHPQTLARYAAQSIKLVRTDECGALWWQAGQLQCTRKMQQRYWHWKNAP